MGFLCTYYLLPMFDKRRVILFVKANSKSNDRVSAVLHESCQTSYFQPGITCPILTIAWSSWGMDVGGKLTHGSKRLPPNS